LVRPRHRGSLIAACQCQGIPTATSLVVPRRRMHGTTRPRPPVTGLARSPGVEAFALSRPRPRPASPTACRCRTRSRAPSGFLPPSAKPVRSRGARGTPAPAAPPGRGCGTGRPSARSGPSDTAASDVARVAADRC